uniref:Uncharacterized protein n=1 Tax=Candidatus Kentrum sp. LFY TaxID=2126342 RepID=A0A450UEF4_9GAMM|nr:MAG: hypothetical protein BECKLFY1418B_GA0070995_10223 [Candidatus Kentron sp. LFY]
MNLTRQSRNQNSIARIKDMSSRPEGEILCIWNFSSQKISRYARNDRLKILALQNFLIVLFKIFRVTDYMKK